MYGLANVCITTYYLSHGSYVRNGYLKQNLRVAQYTVGVLLLVHSYVANVLFEKAPEKGVFSCPIR